MFIATVCFTLHRQWKSRDTNAHCAQANQRNTVVNAPKWSEWTTFCFYRMTRSPRRLNSAQYDENCQIEFQTPCHANFFPSFPDSGKIFEVSVSNCIRKKNVGSKTLRQKLKKGSPYCSQLLTWHWIPFPNIKGSGSQMSLESRFIWLSKYANTICMMQWTEAIVCQMLKSILANQI